jgi:lipoprotein-releasing system permease protein
VSKRTRLPFTYFIALRYLKPKRTFLSLITLISITGVVLGIAVLIVIISVFTGFEREIESKIIGFDAMMFINANGPGPESGFIKNWRDLLTTVEKVPGVVAAAPAMQGRVVAESHAANGLNYRLTPWIRGIDPKLANKVANFASMIVDGKMDLEGDTCVVGSDVASNLQISVGDTLTIYSPGSLNHIIDLLREVQNDPAKKENVQKAIDLLLPTELTVTGIFSTGRYLYDSDYILVPLHIGQELYQLGDAVHFIGIRTSDPFAVTPVKQRLTSLLQPPLQAETWIDRNKDYLDAIRVERTTMFFVLLFIVVVAAFGIMSTLITTTVQKTRDIGVMKALGAKISQVLWIFLAQGMIIGFFGTLIGLITGILAIQYRNQLRDFLSATFHIQLFPAQIYQFAEIPAKIVPRDVALICLSGFIICTVAALIPAYFAARLDPVKALRFE